MVYDNQAFDWDVVNAIKAKGVGKPLFERSMRRAQKILPVRLFENVSVVLVGDAKMRGLNATYRRKDTTTDVLSFSYVEKIARVPHKISGDVIISVPQARRQARALGCPLEDELNRLFAHGILHLAGYDHILPAEANRMRALEDDILAS